MKTGTQDIESWEVVRLQEKWSLSILNRSKVYSNRPLKAWCSVKDLLKCLWIGTRWYILLSNYYIIDKVVISYISDLWAYDLSVGYSPCQVKAGGDFEELHEICRLTFRYLCPTRLSSLSVPPISNTTSTTRVRTTCTTCTMATSPTNGSALLKALVCSARNFQYQYLFIYCILYTYCPLIVWHKVGVVIAKPWSARIILASRFVFGSCR